MRQGKSLQQLATRLEEIRATAKDFIVPARNLQMGEDTNLNFEGFSGGMNNWAHSQVASYAEIPKPYYERIRAENPGLLAKNVNWAFYKFMAEASEKNKKESRMIRTLDGQVRAFLGSKYRRLDCYDLLEAVFPVLEGHALRVESSEITEQKMYIQCATERLTAEVKKGDVVQYGLTISSSDVGGGSVRVEPLMYRLVCQNGLIMPIAMRKFHTGRDQAGDDVYEILSDETKELSDKAFWNQVRDIVSHSLKPEIFNSAVNRLREAAEVNLVGENIDRIVELSMKQVGVTGEDKKQGIVAALARGCDGAGLTKWGLMNAFTEVAQRNEIAYDDSVQMQRAAGKILELPSREWLRISEGA